MNIKKQVVKVKKLQKLGGTARAIIIPCKWIEEMNWSQDTEFSLEFLPNRKQMILTEDIESGQENSDIVVV